MKNHYDIISFLEVFTEDECYQYILNLIFPKNEVYCVFCGLANPYKTKGNNNKIRYRCRSGLCGDFYLKSLTIFKNSKLSFRQIFFIIYLNSVNKKNQSSVQFAKNIGITQKTAWGIQSIIRQQYFQDESKLGGVVEVDEAFVSKNPSSKLKIKWGGISTRKEPILGLIERGGEVKAFCVPNRKKETVIEMIKKYVEPGTTIYTDGYAGYRSLENHGYKHDWVEHSTREYVRGDCHTNSIEGFWSHFKKSIRNAHHSVSVKHLPTYLNEAVFKYNNRSLTQMERFDKILKLCI